jgi:flagellar FliL protein
MRKLLPVLLALLGLGGGIGAGLALKPAPPAAEVVAEADGGAHGEAAAHVQGEAAEAPPASAAHGGTEEAAAEEDYVKLNNQFVVPVVADGKVTALVVMSVSLQVGAGGRETVFAREPKLRDSFLQVLFDHANAGGFDGTFTTAENLRTLRMALLEAARSVLGETVTDILIIDMMRQDS